MTKDDRAARLAEELRRNLYRRKARARETAVPPPPADEDQSGAA